ncbi:hypothetical protein D8814_03215 [Streptococcus gordonii]|jgi:hypothetical protein|uniref:DUF6773 family protein n=2 Tax=Streptococcus TaxID=1301 RepID=UPI000AAC3495|nr:hypothetical protein D8814_03215 [Streptococcus gordonii]RSJ61552.1 hypothetical protein D8810_07555 [Streptococcus gordonii]SQF27202.1 Uncharacterised protein [Streptococcus gordonii]VTS98217.1 Uncharacterised protein [Streptococcus gordonii]
MEAFILLLYGALALYAGSVAMNAGAIHYQPFLILIAIAGLYFLCRAQYLGANYYNSFSLTIWGVLLATGFLTLLIACQNFQLNHAIYHNSVFHPMFLLAILVTFCIHLPLILVANIFLEAISKSQKKRFERYLNQLEEE